MVNNQFYCLRKCVGLSFLQLKWIQNFLLLRCCPVQLLVLYCTFSYTFLTFYSCHALYALYKMCEEIIWRFYNKEEIRWKWFPLLKLCILNKVNISKKPKFSILKPYLPLERVSFHSSWTSFRRIQYLEVYCNSQIAFELWFSNS